MNKLEELLEDDTSFEEDLCLIRRIYRLCVLLDDNKTQEELDDKLNKTVDQLCDFYYLDDFRNELKEFMLV